MWNVFARLMAPAPQPHELLRVDPKHFEALATDDSVAGDAQRAPDEYRTRSTRAREILENLDAKDGVSIHSLNRVSNYWRDYDPLGSDAVALRDLGIELPEAMAELVAAQLTISAHALDSLGFKPPLDS